MLWKHGNMFPAPARPLGIPEVSVLHMGLLGLVSCPTLLPSVKENKNTGENSL